LIQRCENPHPHFKAREGKEPPPCNAKVGATSEMPGTVAFEVVCGRCGGGVEFIIENPVVDKVSVAG